MHRHYSLNGVPRLARYVQLVPNMNAANDQDAVIFLDLTGHMADEILWPD